MSPNYIVKNDIFQGRLLPHESEERDIWKTEKWRLRDLQHHPIDPNWESGKYLKCHSLARYNRKLKPNTIIFDLVGMKGHGNSRFIRSAFLINRMKAGTLYFDSFYFSDGKPLKSPKNVTRSSYGVKLEKDEVIRLLKRMKKNSYCEYKVGQKPKSITYEDWKEMKKAARESMSKYHHCKLG